MAGGEQYKERRPGDNAQHTHSWAQLTHSTDPRKAAHDLALVALGRYLEQGLYRLNGWVVRCVTRQSVANLQQGPEVEAEQRQGGWDDV